MSRPTASAWAEAVGAEREETGAPTLATVADHLRQMVGAHGLLSRSRLMSALSESYAPLTLTDDVLKPLVDEALNQLVRLGDVDLLMTASGRAYAPTPPRVVDWGGGQGVLLGSAGPVSAASLTVARRGSCQALRAEAKAGGRTLEDELGVPSWREALVLAEGIDQPGLGPRALFRHLADLASVGDPLEREGGDRMRVVAASNPYFGRRDAPEPEGRWTSLPENGDFLGARKTAFSWTDMVVSITDGRTRVLSRPDGDAWRWAAIGVTQAAGDPLTQRRSDGLQFLIPLPHQLNRAASLCGEFVAPRRFALDANAEAAIARFVGPQD